LLRLIQEKKVDVVLLQEIRRNGKSPGEYLFDRLPGWYKRTRGEVAILARWPISNLAVFPLRGSAQRVVLSAQVMAPKRFRATVVHWSRPRLRRAKPSLPVQAQAQTRDFLATQAAIQDSPLPQILAGDFNCPPHHPLSHALSKRLANAFSTTGSGPGWTFPANRPIVRIDHIYAGDGLRPVRAWVGPNVGSDHLPVLADLVFGD
jgi:endonuclease/exonuclease/phosphatase (EEP) superfamily protein YafD